MGGMCGMTGMYADIPAKVKFKETIHVIGNPYFIVLVIKGNLAHFMDLYFLCLSYHLDISNMLKTKYI